MVESEVIQALRRVEQAVAERAPYEAAMIALEACAALPDADIAAQAIAEWRVTLALHYERPAVECERGLLALRALDISLRDRAAKTLAVCAVHAALARRYLPSLVAELEREQDDEVIARMLRTARRMRDGLTL